MRQTLAVCTRHKYFLLSNRCRVLSLTSFSCVYGKVIWNAILGVCSSVCVDLGNGCVICGFFGIGVSPPRVLRMGEAPLQSPHRSTLHRLTPAAHLAVLLLLPLGLPSCPGCPWEAVPLSPTQRGCHRNHLRRSCCPRCHSRCHHTGYLQIPYRYILAVTEAKVEEAHSSLPCWSILVYQPS